MNPTISNLYRKKIPKTIYSCFLCWEKIEPIDKLVCKHCNIYLHIKCQENNTNQFDIRTCPHCKKLDTLSKKYI
jgi:hypothetical protein